MHQRTFTYRALRLILRCLLGLLSMYVLWPAHPLLAANCQPAAGQLLIWAAYIDTWLPAADPLQGTDETDEAIALINMGNRPLISPAVRSVTRPTTRRSFPVFCSNPAR